MPRFSRGKVLRDILGPLIGVVFETLTRIRLAKQDGTVSEDEIQAIASEAAADITELILDHVR